MKSERIAIVGTSGSGKSTLAQRICHCTGYKDIELDAIYWKPNWVGSTTEELREKLVFEISSANQYVIHGNYRSIREMVWKNVDTVIWLDYSRSLVMYRVIRRTIGRVITGEKLWGINTETLANSIFSKDSIILWAWSTYKKRKKDYEALIKDNPYQVKKIVRVRRPKEIRNIERLLELDCQRDSKFGISLAQLKEDRYMYDIDDPIARRNVLFARALWFRGQMKNQC